VGAQQSNSPAARTLAGMTIEPVPVAWINLAHLGLE
jgi:hypothetical protein